MMIGYIKTDENLMMSSFQLELNKWYYGKFFVYKHLIGVVSDQKGSRIWKVEAENVEKEFIGNHTGTARQFKAGKIKLLSECNIDYTTPTNIGVCNHGLNNTGHYNEGSKNCGDGNVGAKNTGSANEGVKNSGDGNIGDCNTGDHNVGYMNVGSCNTGTTNVGNDNIGNWNVGSRNIGISNVGNTNVGSGNVGSGNATNNSTGFFCMEEPTIRCFDVDTGLTLGAFWEKYPSLHSLEEKLRGNSPIPFEDFSDLPGITKEKLEKLHAKFQEARLTNQKK